MSKLTRLLSCLLDSTRQTALFFCQPCFSFLLVLLTGLRDAMSGATPLFTPYHHVREPQPPSRNAASPTAEGDGMHPAPSAPPPPPAIPYITIHNSRRASPGQTSVTGSPKTTTPPGHLDSSSGPHFKRVILPMVAGLESTFLANTLQGLLCLPGCESVYMGAPAAAATATAALPVVAGGSDGDGARGPCTAGSPSPVTAKTSVSSQMTDDASLGPSFEMETEKATSVQPLQSSSSGEEPQLLRGGIRNHWGKRCETVASVAYTDYILHHYQEYGITLCTAPNAAPSRVVDAVELDALEELEAVRGPTPVIPRCMAPVSLPTVAAAASLASALQQPSHLYRPAAGGGKSGSGSGDGGAEPCCSGADSSCRERGSSGQHPTPSSAAMLLGRGCTEKMDAASHHSSESSPPPSGHEEDDDDEEENDAGTHFAVGDFRDGATSSGGGSGGRSQKRNDERGNASCRRHRHSSNSSSGSSSSSGNHGGSGRGGSGRVASRRGRCSSSHSEELYRCFASNCVGRMPVYAFPQLTSDDLVDLSAFMVTRSLMRPDEAVDLELATTILGSPQVIQSYSAEEKAALTQRAVQLLSSASFLQV